MKKWYLLLLLLLLLPLLLLTTPACASKAPPGLSPVGVRVWQANEAVVALGTAQHAAIELNKIQVCEPAPCHPLLSTRNTGVVVDAVTLALTTLRAVPDGWRATSLAALDTIIAKLDADGKTRFASYLTAARTIINAIGGQ